MGVMGAHPEFVGLVRTMYTGARLRFKVNGMVDSESASPTNGLAQGCPLSPLLYLMCIHISQ